MHGRGVFALQPIAEGEIVIQYVGEIISWDEAQDRHPQNPDDPNHTFYFQRDDGCVIDAGHHGNSARWINHSCEPNCSSEETEAGEVYIYALRNIAAGEEITYDYGLTLDERYTPRLKAEYACHCGSARCRGTMLAPKRRLRALPR